MIDYSLSFSVLSDSYCLFLHLEILFFNSMSAQVFILLRHLFCFLVFCFITNIGGFFCLFLFWFVFFWGGGRGLYVLLSVISIRGHIFTW